MYPLDWAHVEEWSPQRLEEFIAGYGWDEPLEDGRVMRVTPIETAGGDLVPLQKVMRRGDDGPPHIDFDLPLNGEWSDLTAEFHLVKVDQAWAFTLWNLHVM